MKITSDFHGQIGYQREFTESKTSRLNSYLEITCSNYDRMRENSKIQNQFVL